jgi:pimeloyl-ACP methyl ester carboxylesterase
MKTTILMRGALAMGIAVAAACDGEAPSGAAEVALPDAGPDAVPLTGQAVAWRCPWSWYPERLGLAEIECWRVWLPENRAHRGTFGGAEGPKVSLSVALFRGRDVLLDSEPMLYIAGGPGSESVWEAMILIWSGHMAEILKTRNIVAVDLRGTGDSFPVLPCLEVDKILRDDLRLSSDAAKQAIRRCAEDFRTAGIDLDQYATAPAVDDLESVRRLIGLPRWHVFGVSYGTRVALELLRRHPDGIRSLVLDSTLPPQVDLIAEFGPSAQRALDVAFSNCDEDPACRERYPMVSRVFLDLVTHLDQEPVVLENESGDRVRFDGYLLARMIRALLYSAAWVPHLPRLIFDMRDGDFWFARRYYDGIAGLGIPLGTHLSVMCADEMAFTSRDTIVGRAAEAVTPELRGALTETYYQEACTAWSVSPSPPEMNQAVVSDKPVLLLAGRFDPVTPPAWAHLAAQTLSDSRVVELPDWSHGVVTSPCAPTYIRAFLENLTLPDGPPRECVQRPARQSGLRNEAEGPPPLPFSRHRWPLPPFPL